MKFMLRSRRQCCGELEIQKVKLQLLQLNCGSWVVYTGTVFSGLLNNRLGQTPKH